MAARKGTAPPGSTAKAHEAMLNQVEQHLSQDTRISHFLSRCKDHKSGTYGRNQSAAYGPGPADESPDGRRKRLDAMVNFLRLRLRLRQQNYLRV